MITEIEINGLKVKFEKFNISSESFSFLATNEHSKLLAMFLLREPVDLKFLKVEQKGIITRCMAGARTTDGIAEFDVEIKFMDKLKRKQEAEKK